MLSGLVIPLSGESYSVVRSGWQPGENPAHAYTLCVSGGKRLPLSGPQLRLGPLPGPGVRIPWGVTGEVPHAGEK